MSKKKKFNSLEDLSGMVYSTNKNYEPDDVGETESLSPADQHLEAHLEKKGRGGKIAVIIRGFVGSEEDLRDLGRQIKSHCATGGSAKNGDIIVQGPVRDKVMQFSKDKGYAVKRVGG
ncbi:MAG: translation initiation factor [Owenweeksia sp.]|nr:translation initiation factor [Owenweeksia sp.]